MTPARQRLAILLCTFNGGRYLGEQLRSIAVPAQTTAGLWVSDDGSTDTTLEDLRAYAAAHPDIPVAVRYGPGRGHAANFLSLVTAADIAADYYAYCDQDDLWDSDKLHRALAWLATVEATVPALYCSRTRNLSAQGTVQGQSPLFQRPPAFANALVQNIGGGNTMVMNAAARKLLCEAGPVDVVSHDWWTYILVSGAGGCVHYDPEPSLCYRQHAGNAVGANTGLRSRMRRYWAALWGRNRDWNAANIRALQHCKGLLSAENQQLLAQYEGLCHGGLITRLRCLYRGKFYAQTLAGNVGLYVAVLLRRL